MATYHAALRQAELENEYQRGVNEVRHVNLRDCFPRNPTSVLLASPREESRRNMLGAWLSCYLSDANAPPAIIITRDTALAGFLEQIVPRETVYAASLQGRYNLFAGMHHSEVAQCLQSIADLSNHPVENLDLMISAACDLIGRIEPVTMKQLQLIANMSRDQITQLADRYTFSLYQQIESGVKALEHFAALICQICSHFRLTPDCLTDRNLCEFAAMPSSQRVMVLTVPYDIAEANHCVRAELSSLLRRRGSAPFTLVLDNLHIAENDPLEPLISLAEGRLIYCCSNPLEGIGQRAWRNSSESAIEFVDYSNATLKHLLEEYGTYEHETVSQGGAKKHAFEWPWENDGHWTIHTSMQPRIRISDIAGISLVLSDGTGATLVWAWDP